MKIWRVFAASMLGTSLAFCTLPSVSASENFDFETSQRKAEVVRHFSSPFFGEDGDSGMRIVEEGYVGDIRYRVVEEGAEPINPGISTRMKVGAGRFLYLYVNRDEFNGLSVGAGAAYTGLVCKMITVATGGLGGIACTAITQGVFAYLRGRDAPGPRQCGEIKLMWGIFAPVGYKVINKPCSKV